MAKEKLVPIEDVADILKIAPLTLFRWLVDGRLIVRIGGDAVRQKIYVTADSIRNAYKVTCIHCGKVFLARGPKRARYCSIKCRNAYAFQQWKLRNRPVRKKAR